MQQIPLFPFLGSRFRWKWWIGGLCIVSIYLFVFYAFFVSPTGFRWRAIYGDPDYPDGYEIRGIDVSHYQGRIDWEQLRHAFIKGTPVRFAIIKATEGSTYVDENFQQNFYDARENGFMRGAYHFWSNTASARDQANFFLEHVSLEAGDLPPILDVERQPPQGMSVSEFQRNVLEWLDIMEKWFGVKPIVYSNVKFKTLYLNDPSFDAYPFWIAHYYVSRMEYKGEWKFWQHTDAGRLPGIKGYVDLNIYNGSYYDLRQLTIPEQEESDEWEYDNFSPAQADSIARQADSIARQADSTVRETDSI